jgi:hypothetical protein
VIFKLSTDLKYLGVVQGGVSSLFFTCAPSHIGAVQRKHILKVKKFLKRMITNLIGMRVNWVNSEVGYHYVCIRVLSIRYMFECTGAHVITTTPPFGGHGMIRMISLVLHVHMEFSVAYDDI